MCSEIYFKSVHRRESYWYLPVITVHSTYFCCMFNVSKHPFGLFELTQRKQCSQACQIRQSQSWIWRRRQWCRRTRQWRRRGRCHRRLCWRCLRPRRWRLSWRRPRRCWTQCSSPSLWTGWTVGMRARLRCAKPGFKRIVHRRRTNSKHFFFVAWSKWNILGEILLWKSEPK